MNLRWRRVHSDNLQAVHDFLAERESSCVAACERLLAWNEGPDHLWEAHERRGPIRSVLLLSATGILYPIFSNPGDEDNRTGLLRCLALRRVRSIQGATNSVDVAEATLVSMGYQNPERIDYELMRLDGEPSPAALAAGPPALTLRLATREEATEIFPLQAAYEIEEVVPKGSQFKVAASRLALERTLGTRTVLLAILDGRIVGKANTNAHSFTRDQIGGVYVLPEFRDQGIARRLVAELCSRLHAEGRTTSLFVKKRNAQAQKAYGRVGFEAFAGYRITYFH